MFERRCPSAPVGDAGGCKSPFIPFGEQSVRPAGLTAYEIKTAF